MNSQPGTSSVPEVQEQQAQQTIASQSRIPILNAVGSSQQLIGINAAPIQNNPVESFITDTYCAAVRHMVNVLERSNPLQKPYHVLQILKNNPEVKARWFYCLKKSPEQQTWQEQKQRQPLISQQQILKILKSNFQRHHGTIQEEELSSMRVHRSSRLILEQAVLKIAQRSNSSSLVAQKQQGKEMIRSQDEIIFSQAADMFLEGRGLKLIPIQNDIMIENCIQHYQSVEDCLECDLQKFVHNFNQRHTSPMPSHILEILRNYPKFTSDFLKRRGRVVSADAIPLQDAYAPSVLLQPKTISIEVNLLIVHIESLPPATNQAIPMNSQPGTSSVPEVQEQQAEHTIVSQSRIPILNAVGSSQQLIGINGAPIQNNPADRNDKNPTKTYCDAVRHMVNVLERSNTLQKPYHVLQILKNNPEVKAHWFYCLKKSPEQQTWRGQKQRQPLISRQQILKILKSNFQRHHGSIQEEELSCMRVRRSSRLILEQAVLKIAQRSNSSSLVAQKEQGMEMIRSQGEIIFSCLADGMLRGRGLKLIPIQNDVMIENCIQHYQSVEDCFECDLQKFVQNFNQHHTSPMPSHILEILRNNPKFTSDFLKRRGRVVSADAVPLQDA